MSAGKQLLTINGSHCVDGINMTRGLNLSGMIQTKPLLFVYLQVEIEDVI